MQTMALTFLQSAVALATSPAVVAELRELRFADDFVVTSLTVSNLVAADHRITARSFGYITSLFCLEREGSAAGSGYADAHACCRVGRHHLTLAVHSG
jgi:hypothetical protein